MVISEQKTGWRSKVIGSNVFVFIFLVIQFVGIGGIFEGFRTKIEEDVYEFHPFDWDTKPVLYLVVFGVACVATWFVASYENRQARWGARALLAIAPAGLVATLFLSRGL